jgi:phenylpropionate dioxygenase-like ring-hydroxylating dioxygenase large terminal subunit
MAEANQRAIYSRTNDFNVSSEAAIYRSFRHFWHPVLYSHDLGDAPVRTNLCGEQLVVARLEDEVCVFEDLCAHRGTALSLGNIEDGQQLRCPYHGWQYDKAGRCVLTPQRPELARSLNARLTKYQASEHYGMIWVSLVDEPVFPLPGYPQYSDSDIGLAHIWNPVTDWECSAARRVENYTDLSHFAQLHDGVVGTRDIPEVPEHRVWRDGNALCMDLVEHNSGNFKMTWQIYMPLTVIVYNANLERGWHAGAFFHATPVEPRRTRNFTITSRNFYRDEWLEQALSLQDVVYEQDRPVVESQRPEELPEDLSEELHVKNVDTYSLHYRKWLLELARECESRDSGASRKS